MPIPVKLSEVVDEMSMSGDEISTYLNRVTGEMVTVTAEERRAAEDPEDWDLLPGWQQEVMPKVKEALESEDYLKLPGKYEIHEWSIMEQFAYSVDDEAASDELLTAIHGRRRIPVFQGHGSPSWHPTRLVPFSRRSVQEDRPRLAARPRHPLCRVSRGRLTANATRPAPQHLRVDSRRSHDRLCERVLGFQKTSSEGKQPRRIRFPRSSSACWHWPSIKGPTPGRRRLEGDLGRRSGRGHLRASRDRDHRDRGHRGQPGLEHPDRLPPGRPATPPPCGGRRGPEANASRSCRDRDHQHRQRGRQTDPGRTPVPQEGGPHAQYRRRHQGRLHVHRQQEEEATARPRPEGRPPGRQCIGRRHPGRAQRADPDRREGHRRE